MFADRFLSRPDKNMGRGFFYISLWWGVHVQVLKTLAALALMGCSDEQGFKALAAIWLFVAQIEGRSV